MKRIIFIATLTQLVEYVASDHDVLGSTPKCRSDKGLCYD